MGARLRQLRMPVKRCDMPNYLEQFFPNCIGEYNGNEEDENSYPIGWTRAAASYLYANASGNSEFIYKSDNTLNGSAEMMTLGTYSAGGYTGDFGSSANSAMNELLKLYFSQWVDLQSRNLIVEFITFNPTTELFSSAQIAFEVFAGGNILTWSQFLTLRLDKYSGHNGIPIIIFQILCLVFIIFYVFRGVAAIIQQRLNFFLV